jgi:DNA-binding transcriptional LysR family regulator
VITDCYDGGLERPETREFEYFVAVAEKLHFGRTAERLGIAQPPLSRAIGRLERRMGVQLFERTSRRVDLTAAGAAFQAERRKVLTALDATVSRAQRIDRPPRLVVAAHPGTGSGLLVSVLRAYCRQPGAVDVEVVFTRDQVDLVRDGSADVALMCERGGLDGVEFTELVEQETVALLPLDHFLAERSAVSTADLTRDRLSGRNWPEARLDEIIDKVAMGELIVMVGANATDRIRPAVLAVPVVDAPSTTLMLTWRLDIPAATRDAFVRTAKSVAAGHVGLSAPGAEMGGTAVGNQLEAREVAALVRCKEQDRIGLLLRPRYPGQRDGRPVVRCPLAPAGLVEPGRDEVVVDPSSVRGARRQHVDPDIPPFELARPSPGERADRASGVHNVSIGGVSNLPNPVRVAARLANP